ncbi:MAG: undecaprenyl-diphosphooligosaccharide--protein glycosyltransferase [Myxococcota bacterium]
MTVWGPRVRLALFSLALLAVFATAAGVRWSQWQAWQASPETYFAHGEPMISTLDAPFFLIRGRHAAGAIDEPLARASFPDRDPEFREARQLEPWETPRSDMLSELIGATGSLLDGRYHLAANLLIPLLAALFVLPLGLFFFRLGLPVVGLFGGLVGALAFGYLGRTSIGRIDTDLLNLFFPVAIPLALLAAAKAEALRPRLIWSAVAGILSSAFMWWYFKPGFTLGWAIALPVTLLLARVPLKQVAACTLLFCVLADPRDVWSGMGATMDFLTRYVSPPPAVGDADGGPAVFGGYMSTISEARKVEMEPMLKRVLPNVALVKVGLAGFGVLCFWRWKFMVLLGPLVALGGMAFVSGNRFVMYLAPVVGMGLGTLASLAGLGAETLAQKKWPKVPNGPGVALASAALLYVLWPGFRTDYVPGPKIPAAQYTALTEIKGVADPAGVVVTWWDYGYAVANNTGLRTVHDGGVRGEKTYFVARALTAPSQPTLHTLSRFVVGEGNTGIRALNTTATALQAASMAPEQRDLPPIYVLYTRDLLRKFGAIAGIGSPSLTTGKRGWGGGFKRLTRCSIRSRVVRCRGNLSADLNTGVLTRSDGRKEQLKRAVFQIDEQLVERPFKGKGRRTVQIHRSAKKVHEAWLLNEGAYRSNLNQMFLLGKADPALFEEVYNKPRQVRLFRLR